jgi:hypothetical protein
MTEADVVERLKAACIGHPNAKIAWPHRILHDASALIERLIAERDALKQALIPSVATKAAYMGEFSVSMPELDENGDEYVRPVNVPWIVIKEIMAAIRARASLTQGAQR